MKPRVLIIEDNKQIMFLYEMFLKETFEICKVHSYEELITFTNEEPPSFIIMDYTIKGVDFEVLREYVTNTYPAIKILLITGSTEADGYKEMYPDTFVGVWHKPIYDLEKIAVEIKNYI